ncbi:MAG: alpha/beta hydrolase [Roseivirga sp.]|nr:alpha/beta hydrolase [Roseivirga sp.]
MLYHKTFHKSDDAEWVVFIHGAGGSSSIWYKQLRSFKEEFNVLLIDLRGHGQSQEMFQRFFTNDYNFENISQDVVDVMDHLAIEKGHFVGISLGTIIIRSICEIAPDKVQSLILGGAVTRLNIRSKFLVAFGNAVKRLVPFMWLYRFFAWIIMPRKRNAESRMLFISQAKKLAQSEFLKWFKLTNDLNPLLRYFNEKDSMLPTLYLMGDQDYMFLPQVMVLVKKHEFSRLSIIENSGHVCNVEQPEVFNNLSIEFIKQHAH